MTDIRFPPLSSEEPETEGVVATWFIGDGEAVQVGQLLAEVQLDKVSFEVDAPAAGVVHLAAKEGVAVRQGDVIATIDVAG